MYFTVKLIVQRWTHLRDNYGRSCRKIQDQKRSGIKPAKPYIYSKKCSFLQSVLQHKETITNVTTENSNTESEYNFQTNEESEINSIKNDVTKNVTSRILKRPTNTDTYTPIEAKMIKFMDSFSQEPKVTNRHLSFFNGILPTLDNFDDNEAIEFQMGVLHLLKRIKTSRQNQLLNYGHQEPSSRGYFAQEYDDPATDSSKTNVINVQASLQSPQSVDSSYSNYSVKVEDL